MKTYPFTELPQMPPLTSRKVRHPASTAAAPAFLEIFDWQPAHLRPAVALARSFGAKGQTVGEAMRSFVVVRAYDIHASAATRGAEERWCWWDDLLDAATGGASSDLAPELEAARAELARVRAAIAQFVEATK